MVAPPIKRFINVSAVRGSSLECIQAVIGRVKGWHVSDKTGTNTDDAQCSLASSFSLSLSRSLALSLSHSLAFSLCTTDSAIA
jgi:hypothetical protein